jgi:hypothetical protein
MSDVIDLDANRPGWWSGIMLCKVCRHWQMSVAHPQAKLTELECEACHAQDSIPAQIQESPEGFEPTGL